MSSFLKFLLYLEVRSACRSPSSAPSEPSRRAALSSRTRQAPAILAQQLIPTSVSDPDPDGSSFFADLDPNLKSFIRTLKTFIRIRPFFVQTNYKDLNDFLWLGFGGIWPKRTRLRVLKMLLILFLLVHYLQFFFFSWIRIRISPDRIRIFGRSWSGLRKKVLPDPDKRARIRNIDSKTCF